MKKYLLLLLFSLIFVVYSYAQNESGKYATFKGMLDGGFIIIPNYSEKGLGISGNFGYQFNRYLFLGAGIGCYKFFDKDDFFVPFYANFRINPLRPKVAPFVDLKFGLVANDIEAGYVSAGGGIRIKNDKTPITFGMYYSVLFRGFYEGGAGSHYDGLVLKLGVEF